MRRGEESPTASALIDRVYGGALAFRPRDARQTTIQGQLLERLQVAAANRRHRIDDNSSGVSPLLWAVLWLGAAVVICFGYLFGLQNVYSQLIMTAGLAIVIGALFVVIMEFDYPFRGDVSLTADTWEALRTAIRHGAIGR